MFETVGSVKAEDIVWSSSRGLAVGFLSHGLGVVNLGEHLRILILITYLLRRYLRLEDFTIRTIRISVQQ